MKVLFLTADNVYLTPYLNTYLEILKSKKMDYHVIYWDKNENEELNNPKYTKHAIGNNKLYSIIIISFLNIFIA